MPKALQPKPWVYRQKDYRDGIQGEDKFPVHPCLTPDCPRLVRARKPVYCIPCVDSMECA